MTFASTANFLRKSSRRIRKRKRTKHTHFLLKESQEKCAWRLTSLTQKPVLFGKFFLMSLGSDRLKKSGLEGGGTHRLVQHGIE